MLVSQQSNEKLNKFAIVTILKRQTVHDAQHHSTHYISVQHNVQFYADMIQAADLPFVQCDDVSPVLFSFFFITLKQPQHTSFLLMSLSGCEQKSRKQRVIVQHMDYCANVVVC